MSGQLLHLIIPGIFIAWLELSHRLRSHSPLKLEKLSWKITNVNPGLKAIGCIEIINPHPRMEVMVPEFEVIPKLLGKERVDQISIKTTIKPNHPDEASRKDGYWQAYIVKSRKKTTVQISLELDGDASLDPFELIENIWLEIHWINYGPFGRVKLQEGFVLPIKQLTPLLAEQAYFKQYKDFQLLPIKTHLLGPLDNIVEAIERYTSQIIQPGDILTIGETPLAVMQGRYSHPSNISPGFVSKLLCVGFHPTSSLATACGLQSLINLVGPTRVIISFLIGFIGKLLGIKGLFYRLAGTQARLIDDITGTTPPYDQTIVFGPIFPQKVCEEISERLGINVAIVDVNDLGKVKVLASSDNCDKSLLLKALKTNPAGNANEQTPLVLVRPY